MVGDTRQGWAMLAAMLVILRAADDSLPWPPNKRACRPTTRMGVDQASLRHAAGGNMEGKETRFGIANSALWATATTAASNGSVNSMHDSFTPLGGLVPMWLMQLGEVIFGGVGSGLYGMLMFAIVAVFVAGLMVGRTPEYLGKKIEAYEMKMASLVILIPPLVVLVGTAIAVAGPGLDFTDPDERKSKATLNNPGAHGFSRSALRLFLGRQQQRQRLRRPHREHAVLQHRPGHRDAHRPLLADDSDAGDRRFARRERNTRRRAPARCRRIRRCLSSCS